MMWPGSVFEYQGTTPTFAQVCIGLKYRIIYLNSRNINYINKIF